MDGSEFHENVQCVLRDFPSGRVKRQIFGETPYGQKFAVIITQGFRWAVLIIFDEDYSDLPIVESINCFSNNVIKKKEFVFESSAIRFARETARNYINGDFENIVRDRIRELPKIHPELHLKPGDIIRRKFVGNLAYHEGIYLSDGRVAHINNENGTSIFEWKKNSGAKIDSLVNFLKDENAFILVPCIRRRTRERIFEIAFDFANRNYGRGLYNLLVQNCQHFTSLCVYGHGVTSDKYRIKGGFRNIATFSVVYAIAVYSLISGPYLGVGWGG